MILIGSYIFVFIVVWFIFKAFEITASISNIVFLSIMPTFTIKGIFDIKYETGNPKFYAYSRETNQKLRYIAFSVTLLFAVFLFYIHIF